MHRIVAAMVLLMLSISPAFAASTSTLLAAARVPMDQAIQSALAALPGKAYKAEIEKESGRVVYEIEILEQASGKDKTVYVDAETGKIMKIK